MNELDKWAAEQCGVSAENHFKRWSMPDADGLLRTYEWTLNDARCREIAREKFKIDTFVPVFGDNKWRCEALFQLLTNEKISGTGDTIAEAEIACIKAIYEGEK